MILDKVCVVGSYVRVILKNNMIFCRKYEYLCKDKLFQNRPIYRNDTGQSSRKNLIRSHIN